MNEWLTSQQWFQNLNAWLSVGLNPEWEVWFVNTIIPVLAGIALFIVILILVFGNGKHKEKEECKHDDNDKSQLA